MSEDIVVVPSSQVKQRWEAMNKQASALHRPAELTRISEVDRVLSEEVQQSEGTRNHFTCIFNLLVSSVQSLGVCIALEALTHVQFVCLQAQVLGQSTRCC